MPTKEFEREQLFFIDEETGIHSLGEFTELTQDKKCEASEDIPVAKIGMSCEFTAEIQTPKGMTVGDVALTFCGFDVEKLKQNNWRKMHGMIMHREVQKCKIRRRGKNELLHK